MSMTPVSVQEVPCGNLGVAEILAKDGIVGAEDGRFGEGADRRLVVALQHRDVTERLPEAG